MLRILLFIKVSVIILAMSVNVFANGAAGTFGMSAQGMSMGNAMTSIVNDWSSVYYNIGGLGRTAGSTEKTVHFGKKTMALKKKSNEETKKSSEKVENPNEIYLGFMYSIPVLNLDINRVNSSGVAQPTTATEDLNTSNLQVGVALDLNVLYKMPPKVKKIISSLRLGVGAVLNGDFTAVKINDIDMRTHYFNGYGRDAQTLVAILGLGIGFLDDMFGVGGGINIAFGGEGSMQLDDVNVTATPQIPEGQTQLDFGLHVFAVAGFYFDFGKAVKVLRGLSLGASYRQETYLNVKPVNAITIIQSGNIQMLLRLEMLDFYTPHIVTAGISYTRWNVTLSFDVESQMWSFYKDSKAYKNSIVQYTFNKLGFNLPDYDNIFIYKVGVSYEPLTWLKVMVGYYYQPTYIPDEATESIYNAMDTDKHVASLGATFGLPKFGGLQAKIEITVGYQFQYLATRTINKDQAAIVAAAAGGPYETLYYAGLNPDYQFGGMAHSVFIGVHLKL